MVSDVHHRKLSINNLSLRRAASKVFKHARPGSASLGPGRATGYSALREIISEHRLCAL